MSNYSTDTDCKKVDAILIGAQKAGTSAINQYLGQHPQILCAEHDETSEFTFFSEDNTYLKGYKKYYDSLFPDTTINDKFLFAKNVDIMYNPISMKRLFNHNNKVKVFIVLRNPVNRCHSAYWYARKCGWETETNIDKAIFSKNRNFLTEAAEWSCSYLDKSNYYKHIKNVYDNFSKENINIIIFEDFKKNSNTILNNITEKIGCSNHEFDTSKKINASAAAKSEQLARLVSPGRYRNIAKFFPLRLRMKVRAKIEKLNSKDFTPPKLDNAIRIKLMDYFEPQINDLSELIGKDLDVWRD